MGQFFSSEDEQQAQAPQSQEENLQSIFNDEKERAFIPFLFASAQGGTVKCEEYARDGSGVELRKATAVNTTFIDGYEYGLFATRAFAKDEIVLVNSHKFSHGPNDAMFDLRPIIAACTAVEMEQALRDARSSYYDMEAAERRVNLVLCVDYEKNECLGLKANRYIAAGEELRRVYGFSTWLKDLAELNLLTRHTLPGWLNFLVYMAEHHPHDPFGHYIASVLMIHQEILKQCYGTDYPTKDADDNTETFPLPSSAEFDAYWGDRTHISESSLDNEKVQIYIVPPPIPIFPPKLEVLFGAAQSKYLARLSEVK